MTSLPILPTKANFAHAEIKLEPGLSFFIDGNSKITVGNGTYENPKPNAFSLPAASVDGNNYCPGSTDVCRASCYVRGLAQHAPNVYALYKRNAFTLSAARHDSALGQWMAAVLAEWISENAPRGFRWHVSGDVQDAWHAMWIRYVCRRASTVPFWIYTRTLDAVPILTCAANLAVNVSADRTNYAEALSTAKDTGARICYLASDEKDVPDDLPRGSVIFPDYPLRGRGMLEPTMHSWWQSLSAERKSMVCPTDFFGQSDAHRCGPCTKCL